MGNICIKPDPDPTPPPPQPPRNPIPTPTYGNVKLKWSDLEVTNCKVLHSTAYGVDVKAVLKSNQADVIVKVITSEMAIDEEDFERVTAKLLEEARFLIDAEKLMTYNECVVKTYGLVRGPLPTALCRMFHLNTQTPTQASGIVTSYDNISLEEYLEEARIKRKTISMEEKLRLLRGISVGLSELHAIGFIHSDIKLSNVRLSSDKPPIVRLCGFESAIISADGSSGSNLQESMLMKTLTERGTARYNAPELLYDYTKEDGGISKPTRKTDVFAFALLSWEVLSGQKAYANINSDMKLAKAVHDNVRPDLSALPSDTPPEVIALITACWSNDRNERKTAVQIFSVLNQLCSRSGGRVTNEGTKPSPNPQTEPSTKFDIFLSHSQAQKHSLDYVLHYLVQNKYKVWYEMAAPTDMTLERNKTTKKLIADCSAVICCVSNQYLDTDICMREYRLAREHNKPVICLIMEPTYIDLSQTDFRDLCQPNSNSYVDLKSFAAIDWTHEIEDMKSLYTKLREIYRALQGKGISSRA